MGRVGYEWAGTSAATMLSDALRNAKSELKLTVRKVGHELGYKHGTVVSHMASGREPIPIERAEEIATLLMIDPAAFLQAVVEQRYPNVDWRLINSTKNERQNSLARELETFIGTPLTELNEHQHRVMREVANEPQPQLRWLSVMEASAVRELVNKNQQHEGFPPSQDDIDEILAQLSEDES